MGNVDSAPLARSLRTLLKSRDISLGKQIILSFLKNVNTFAPWFWHTGTLTLPSWEKLGNDIRLAEEEGVIDPMVRPIWEMVRACLRAADTNFPPSQGALSEARRVLEKARSEASEEGSEVDSESSLDSDGEDSEEDEGKTKPKTKWPPNSRVGATEKKGETCPASPSAPPWDPPTGGAPPWGPPPPFSGPGAEPTEHRSFFGQFWRSLSRMPDLADDPIRGPYGVFPVIVDPTRGPYHQSLDFKQVKNLKEAVSSYGPNAPFTQALLENLSSLVLTPADWAQLAKACLSPGQFMEWKAWNAEYCGEQADKNAQTQNRRWNQDMLTGTGPHANNQVHFPAAVYDQVAHCAIRAWKRLPDKGEHGMCLHHLH